MKRCQRCILPSTVPGISFNEAGVCNYCQTYVPQSYLGESELCRIIDKAKSKKSTYDCIVPISGGRDSTYVLYLAKRRLNMNVLAVNYDNEFAPPYVMANMKKACDILNIDFVSVRSKRAYARKIARHNILAATEFGQFRECAACTYGYRSVVYRKAKEFEVPLILWGESKEEATLQMELKAFEPIRRRELKYLKLLKKDFYAAEFYKLLQRLEFFVSWETVFNRRFEPVLRDDNIEEVRMFDYVPWERRKIKETIMEELQWEKPDERGRTWKVDCVLIALTNFYYIKLLGCTKLCFGYNRMINSGQMERAEALKQEEDMLASYSKGLKEILEGHVGLSEKHANRILLYEDKTCWA